MASDQSPTKRREFLKLTGVSSAAMTLLAGCSDAISSEPAYSYEVITGVWHGETPPGRRLHDWATVAFESKQAAVGERIGTVKFLKEKDGEVVCQSSLIAHHSDPPTFWVDVEGGEYPCGTHRRYRFKYKPFDDKPLDTMLVWFLIHDNEDSYLRESSLRRETEG